MKTIKGLTYTAALMMLAFTLNNCVPTATAVWVADQMPNYHISMQEVYDNKHKIEQGTYAVVIEEEISQIKKQLQKSGILTKEVQNTIVTEKIAISDKHSVQYRLTKEGDNYICKPTVINKSGAITDRGLTYNEENVHNKKETVMYAYLIKILEESKLDYSFKTKEIESKEIEIKR